MIINFEKARAKRLREILHRDGYTLRKARRRKRRPKDQRGYMISDADTGIPVGGFRYEWNLNDVEYWVRCLRMWM